MGKLRSAGLRWKAQKRLDGWNDRLVIETLSVIEWNEEDEKEDEETEVDELNFNDDMQSERIARANATMLGLMLDEDMRDADYQ